MRVTLHRRCRKICVLFESRRRSSPARFPESISRVPHIGKVSNAARWLGVWMARPTQGQGRCDGTLGVQVRFREKVAKLSCSSRRMAGRPLIRLLSVGPVGVGLILFALAVEPSRDVARWNGSSGQIRIKSARVDDQPLVELRARELFGFLFSLKCLGCSRASPSLRRPALVHFKCNVPSMRHLAPKDGATGDVSESIKLGSRCQHLHRR